MAVVGRQSIQFDKAPFIIEAAAIVGKKEGEGPFGPLFDKVEEDGFFGKKTWEEAEGELQRQTAEKVLEKAKLTRMDMRYVFAGDLLEQMTASTFGLMGYEIPLIGIYGACSTMGEGLMLASMITAAGYADYTLAVASSHFAAAEKEFRFPLNYGSQRPLSATWTVTGCGAVIVGAEGMYGGNKKRPNARVTGVTTGKVIDYGQKDSMNMGACMAGAACDTIYQNFMDFGRRPEDYDRIITGDLGYVGKTLLLSLLKEKGFDITKQHDDCGILIFNQEKQDTHSGGSGCGCSGAMFAAHILRQVEKGAWKRVLFLPTGALLSKVSFNENRTVPGIAHGVVLEHC